MTLSVAITKQLGAFSLDASFTTGPEVTALFGPSGAGKSTLIKAIAGLVRPDSGQIRFNDTVFFDAYASINVPPHRRRVGVVFQGTRLFPHMSVLKNLLYGARFCDGSVKTADAVAMAGLLGLSDALKRKPASLSGGETQRVAIGRALLSKPHLLMMDEPLSGLDQARKADILALIERVRDVVRVPILYVSHGRDEAVRLARHAVIVKDGRVVQQGNPEWLLGAQAGRGPTFSLQARLVMKNDADGLSELAITGGKLFVPQVEDHLGSVLSVEIAARDVLIAVARPDGLSALNVLRCTITEIRPSASGHASVDVMLDCAGDRFASQVTRRSALGMALSEGMDVYAIIKAAALAQPSGVMDVIDV